MSNKSESAHDSNQVGRSDGTWMKPVRPTRVFDEIVDAIERAIRSGELRAGDRIPSERELSVRLGVSRTAVREAMRMLDGLGMVNVERGSKGVRLATTPGPMLTQHLRLSLALDLFSMPSILEFRSVVEAWAARMVAETRPPEIMARLAELIGEMTEPNIPQLRWQSLHWEFHATLIEGCPNELALSVLRACQEVIAGEMKVAFKRPELGDLQREHQTIYDAIAAGDSDRAADLVAAHIASRHNLGERRDRSRVTRPAEPGRTESSAPNDPNQLEET